MKRHRAALLAIVAVLCGASSLSRTAQLVAQEKPPRLAPKPGQEKPHEISGQWSLVVTFDGGGGFCGTFNLKQQGEKVEGSLVRGEKTVPVKGTFRGRAVILLVEARTRRRPSTSTPPARSKTTPPSRDGC